MRLHTISSASPTLLTSLLLLFSALARSATIHFAILPSSVLPNPASLPPSTHANLYKFNTTRHAPLTRRNTFEFKDVDDGSYLLTISDRDYAWGPLRVDVYRSAASKPEVIRDEKGVRTVAPSADTGGKQAKKQRVEVHQTFWGNEWGNTGEYRGGGVADAGPVRVEIAPERAKDYYMARPGFSPVDFLKNPMILMGLASLVMIVGMPKLMDQMDPETKAEFEEMQKSSPMSSMVGNLQNAGAGGGVPGGFDFAEWMSGRSALKGKEKDK